MSGMSSPIRARTLPEVLRFTRDIAVVPAVNLEAVEAAFLAGGSVIGERGRRVEAAGR